MRHYKAHHIVTTSAPVVATAPAPDVSPRYTFIPTRDIVDGLTSRGWAFDYGTARSTRNPAKEPFAAHVLRFSNPLLPALPDGSRPQAVVINSHGGDGAFHLRFGVFRIACANGLVIESLHAAAIRRRHVGLTTAGILDAAAELLDRAPTVFGAVAEWSRIHPTRDQQVELARAGARIRWGLQASNVNAEDLLAARRPSDTGSDLWSVFNRVQEGVIRGGVTVTRRDEDGTVISRRRSGAIRGALRDVDINRQLWAAAEEIVVTA